MTDVTLVRDRDGDLREVAEPEPEQHTCTGPNGWGPEDPNTGQPSPCFVCRPHLRGAYGPAKVFAYSRFRPR